MWPPENPASQLRYFSHFPSEYFLFIWEKISLEENYIEIIGNSIPKGEGRNAEGNCSFLYFITCHTPYNIVHWDQKGESSHTQPRTNMYIWAAPQMLIISQLKLETDHLIIPWVGVDNFFSIKGQMLSISGFVGHTFFITTTQLCHYSVK